MLVNFIRALVLRRQQSRVRTPTVLHMEAVECGAASLGIILGYYGLVVPLVELRHKCGVSRDGSNAANILKAARSYGLTAKGIKKSLKTLKTFPPPYIVFWNFNHFLVVEGFGKKGVYLNDPTYGRRKVSFEEFDRSYTGLVLVMEPGSTFEKGGEKKRLISALSYRLKNSHGAVIFTLLTGLMLTVPRLAVPAFTQVFVDEILVQARQNWLRPLLWGMAIASVLQGLLAWLQFVYLRRLIVKLLVFMKGQFLWHVLRLPVGFYTQRLAGDISSRAELNDKVVDVLSKIATTVIDAVMLIFYAAIMTLYDWSLSSIAICFAGLNLLALQTLQRSRVDTSLRIGHERGQLSGVTISSIQAIETVKAAGIESYLFSLFAGLYARVLNAQQEYSLQTQVLTVLPVLLSSLSTATILCIGSFKVMDGDLSIGMLVAYQSLVQSFLTPVNRLVSFGSTLQELEASLERLDDVLQTPVDPEITRNQNTNTVEERPFKNSVSCQLQGQIELHNLTFGYNRLETSLIEGFSLTVQPGQRVAIVGKSGSGKSTIAKLIAGLYEPWEGEICFDGIPRNQISRSVLSNSLATVEQDIFLFGGTIRENLTLWNPTVPTSDLVRACEDAAIHELIVSLPGGFDAKIRERGMNLSGGERQRLEIARALVRNPAVLVLDEATSALDAQTESMIDRNLRRRGCSCIIVAHRLSTIRDCDEIIVLEQGRVVQRGTHEELWQQGGSYARLLWSEEAAEFDRDRQRPQQREIYPPNRFYPSLPPTVSLTGRLTRLEGIGNQLLALKPNLIRGVRSIKGNNPLLLDDPKTAWVVCSGSLALFATQVVERKPQGRRHFLFSINVGEAMFGTAPILDPALGGTWNILAVAIEETAIQQVEISDLAAQIAVADQNAVALLECWGQRIAQWTNAQLELNAKVIQVLESGYLSLLEGQVVQQLLETLTWVRVCKGKVSLMGIVSPTLELSSTIFPLAFGMWLEAESSVELHATSTLELENAEQLVSEGLDCLQQYFLQYLQKLVQKKQQEERSRAAQLEQLTTQLNEQTVGELVAVARQQQNIFLQEAKPLSSAASVVGRAIGIKIDFPTESESLCHDGELVEEIARASQFFTRRVVLSGDWWHQEYGPLLAFTREDNHPVALLPERGNSYVLFEPVAQSQTLVNKRIAQKLAKEAYMFYRPLPQSINKISKVFSFGIKGYEKDIVSLVWAGIIGTLLGMVMPLATALLVNHAIPDSDRLLVWQIGLGLLAATLGKSAFQLVQGFVALRVENVTDSTLQPAVWERLLKLPPTFFRRYTSGDLVVRLLAVNQIRRLLSDATQRTLLNGLFSLFNLILMLTFNLKLTLVALGITLSAVGIVIISGLLLVRKERMQEELGGEISGLTVQLIGGAQKLRVAAAEERAFATWTKKFSRQTQLTSDIKKIYYGVLVVNEVLPLVSSTLLFGFAAHFMQMTSVGNVGGLTLGTFLAFNAAFGIFISSVTEMSNTLTGILGIVPLWERAMPILQTETEYDSNKAKPSRLRGRVVLERVTFRYRQEGTLTIDEVSMHAESGEFVAIVGPSGSGKSTLLRLLLGFEKPLGGTVYYDGQDLAWLDVRAVRQQLGVVLQNSRVVSGTIFDNIACGGMMSLEDAWEAVRRAGLADDIEQMPMGMYTVVSESGSNLSVGQQQRLMIARALISKPKIILMDEATSALDSDTQAIVTESLAKLNVTRIVIAHRLSTIRHADRIYVLESGRVVQAGSFEQLVSQEGLFARLVARQLL